MSFSCRYGFCFFFFKQKTAYEMRISDWSSDVCSSDLLRRLVVDGAEGLRPAGFRGLRHADLALRRARAVVLDGAEVHVDERNAREHHHHDRDEHPVLDTGGTQNAFVALVSAFRAGLQPRSEERRVGKECVS